MTWNFDSDVAVPIDQLNYVLMHTDDLAGVNEIRDPVDDDKRFSADYGWSEDKETTITLAEGTDA